MFAFDACVNFRLLSTTSREVTAIVVASKEVGDFTIGIQVSTMQGLDGFSVMKRPSTTPASLFSRERESKTSMEEVFTITTLENGEDNDSVLEKESSNTGGARKVKKGKKKLKVVQPKSPSSPSSNLSGNSHLERSAKSPRLKQITFTPSTLAKERYNSKNETRHGSPVKKSVTATAADQDTILPSAKEMEEVESLTKEVEYLCSLLSKAKEERQEFEQEVDTLSKGLQDSNERLRKVTYLINPTYPPIYLPTYP